MNRKNTILWVVLPIAGILLFLVWLFWPIETHGDPNILNVRPITSTEPVEDAAVEGLVELTPQNVQSVIASLSRPKSYSRTYEVALFWSGGGGSIETVTVNMSEDALTVNGEKINTAGKSSSEMDAYARIPTYEDVLDVPVSEIRSAEYVMRNGKPYIRVRYNGLMYVHEYFISIESGLLEYAIKRDITDPNGVSVYQMTLIS